MIKSKENKKIKYFLSLKENKYREKENKFIIEGIKIVEEYLPYNIIDCVIYEDEIFKNKRGEELLGRIRNRKIEVFEVDEKIIKILSFTESPQGIIAVVNKKSYQLEDIKLKENNLIVILEGIQDPGNLGTIIRTSAAVKTDGMILSKGCVDVYNPKVLRSAAVYLYNFPIIKVEDLDFLISYLKENSFKVILTDPHSEKNYFEIDYSKRIALVLGSEARGISSIWRKENFLSVKVPITGCVESLNVSTAFSVIVYEIVRKRVLS